MQFPKNHSNLRARRLANTLCYDQRLPKYSTLMLLDIKLKHMSILQLISPQFRNCVNWECSFSLSFFIYLFISRLPWFKPRGVDLLQGKFLYIPSPFLSKMMRVYPWKGLFLWKHLKRESFNLRQFTFIAGLLKRRLLSRHHIQSQAKIFKPLQYIAFHPHKILLPPTACNTTYHNWGCISSKSWRKCPCAKLTALGKCEWTVEPGHTPWKWSWKINLSVQFYGAVKWNCLLFKYTFFSPKLCTYKSIYVPC